LRYVLGLALLHCGAPKKPAESGAEIDTSGVDPIGRLLPLEDNTVYSFDTSAESTGQRGILILQISRPRPDRVDLKMGSKVERLEIASDGVRLITGGYLLKTPLDVGASFQGQSGVVRIVDTDKSVQVPAGSFVGCLETVEESSLLGATKKVSTVFCPRVGIVSLIAEANEDGADVRETALLKSFGKRVDIGAPDTP
jgi:hypothetical protein